MNEGQEKKERRFYEIGYILDPDLTGKNLLESYEMLKNLIKNKLEGEIFESAKPKKINLAYPIQKKKNGYFGYIIFEADPQKIISLPSLLKYEKSVLRYILVSRNKEEWKKQQAQISKKKKEEKVDEEKLEKRLEEIIPTED